jgi:3-hydroxyacyl-CoA dehydrogenase
MVVSDSLATVLSGGDYDYVDTISEGDLLTIERAEFMKRVHDPRTMARIEHMLETGKPLRN